MTGESPPRRATARVLSVRRVGAVLGVVVVALLLLSLPSAAGASPAAKALVKFAPPYVGATAYDQNHHAKTGCGGTYTLGWSPSFNLTNGRAQWAAGSAVSACRLGTGGTATNYVRSGVSDLNFTVGTNGSYEVTAHWMANGTFSYSVFSSSNVTTGFSVSYHLAPYLCLMDFTNSSEKCSAPAPYTQTFTVGNGTVGVAFSILQLYQHATLVAGHAYGIEAYLYAYVTASVPAGPMSGNAGGSLNFASTGTPGWGGYLTHVKVFA
jgi:hypothetical protein